MKHRPRVDEQDDLRPRLVDMIDPRHVLVKLAGMRSFPGNPCDGHTLREALEQVEILTDRRPDLAVADRGWRGHNETKTRVLVSGTRRGLTPKLIADLPSQRH